MVDQTTLPEMIFSGHRYVDKLDNWINVAGMVQVELTAACNPEREKVGVLLNQQGQKG